MSVSVMHANRSSKPMSLNIHSVRQFPSRVCVSTAAVCLLLSTSGVLADSTDWNPVGPSAQRATAAVADEWRELGNSSDSDEGWVAVDDLSRNTLKTLVPAMTALDTSGAESAAALLSDGDAASVTPQILEFGAQGSAASQTQAVDEPLQSPDTKNMDLFAGELKVMGKVDITRVAIGNGSIIRAEILKTGELLIIAQSAGSTSLRLWNKDGSQSSYNIRVSGADMETRVRMERMVRMRVRIVEFSTTDLTQLGVDWSVDTAGPSFSTAGDLIGNNLFRPESAIEGLPNIVRPFSTYFGIASNITSKINFFTSKGDATTLAEPVLSAMNGGEASFLAGGEIPYPSQSDNGQPTVDFKEYGIKLKVAPNIDSAGNVRTFVETEVSSIDKAVTVAGAPGLRTRKASTEFNVRSGETIVISGLLTNDISETVKMVPGLGRIPILGKLFRSEQPEEKTTELVIFVTPEVVEPGDPTNTDRENQRYDESTTLLRQARSQLPLME